MKWFESQAAFIAKLPYKLDYDDEKHRYSVAGTVYPSVNQIMDKVFNREYKGDPIYGEIGTASAKAFELDLREELDEETIDSYVRPRLEAFRKWRSESKFSPLYCELPLFADGVTGRLDMAGTINGESWIIDNKCVKNLNHFHTKVQLSGYFTLMVSNGVMEKPKLAALQLKEDGTYHFEPYEIDADALWRSTLILYREKTK